jgi:hypothetical protein
MLGDAYDHMISNGGKTDWSALMAPCPCIGDLRVLGGLALRGLMTDGDHGNEPPAITVWLRWIRITPAGVVEWERIFAKRQSEVTTP